AKAAVAQRRAEKALLSWGLATGLATVLAAAAGFHLLRILVETDGPAWGVVPVWVDALATGLVVGTSTKPVHDLLTRMQQAIALRRAPTGACGASPPRARAPALTPPGVPWATGPRAAARAAAHRAGVTHPTSFPARPGVVVACAAPFGRG